MGLSEELRLAVVRVLRLETARWLVGFHLDNFEIIINLIKF